MHKKMTEEFHSITQYDKSFDNLFTNINHKGFACGFFSVFTVKMFLDFKLKDLATHEKCIKKAMDFTAKNKISYGLNFDDMIKKCCNINNKNIYSTSVELIRENIIGYDNIFENKENKPFGIVFLKNEKYFVVLHDMFKYYIRDCHNDVQYVCDYSELKNILKNSYQFENDIDLLGDFILYSSIEYIKIYDTFDVKNVELNDIKKTTEQEEKKNVIDTKYYENQEKIYDKDDFVFF